MPIYEESIKVVNSNGTVVSTISTHGNITLGGEGQIGNFNILNADRNLIFSFTGKDRKMTIYNDAGRSVIVLDAERGNINIGVRGVKISSEGKVRLGDSVIVLDAQGGNINVKNAQGKSIFEVMSNSSDNGVLYISDGGGNPTIQLTGEGDIVIGGNRKDGSLRLRNGYDKDTIRLHARMGEIALGGNGRNGQFHVKNAGNKDTIRLDARMGEIALGGNGQHGQFHVKNAGNVDTVHINGETGDILLANADCAEDFDISKDEDEIEPGTVMVLDQQGQLQKSTEAYDKKVAGVVSGAGDHRPGIVLDKKPSQNNRVPIALLGKVYCKVDADHSSVEIGDMLTTSSTAGYAMKAVDPLKSFGAVIGKALGRLTDGQGLIPILVVLQ